MHAIDHLLTQPCTISTPTSTAQNSYGDVRPSSPSVVATVGYFEQVVSAEHQVDRDTVISDWLGFLPSGTTISTLSTITIGAQTLQVVGEPELKWNPRTASVDHIECKLRAVKG